MGSSAPHQSWHIGIQPRLPSDTYRSLAGSGAGKQTLDDESLETTRLQVQQAAFIVTAAVQQANHLSHMHCRSSLGGGQCSSRTTQEHAVRI